MGITANPELAFQVGQRVVAAACSYVVVPEFVVPKSSASRHRSSPGTEIEGARSDANEGDQSADGKESRGVGGARRKSRGPGVAGSSGGG